MIKKDEKKRKNLVKILSNAVFCVCSFNGMSIFHFFGLRIGKKKKYLEIQKSKKEKGKKQGRYFFVSLATKKTNLRRLTNYF